MQKQKKKLRRIRNKGENKKFFTFFFFCKMLQSFNV